MRYNVQVALEKSDQLTVRLAAEILDLALHSDRLLEVENIVGVGVDRDDARKTARAHGDTEGTAFPELLIFDGCRRFARLCLGFFRGQPPALSPRVAFRLTLRRKGVFSRLFSSYHGRQCGKFPGPSLLIEGPDFFEAGSWPHPF